MTLKTNQYGVKTNQYGDTISVSSMLKRIDIELDSDIISVMVDDLNSHDFDEFYSDEFIKSNNLNYVLGFINLIKDFRESFASYTVKIEQYSCSDIHPTLSKTFNVIDKESAKDLVEKLTLEYEKLKFEKTVEFKFYGINIDPSFDNVEIVIEPIYPYFIY